MSDTGSEASSSKFLWKDGDVEWVKQPSTARRIASKVARKSKSPSPPAPPGSTPAAK